MNKFFAKLIAVVLSLVCVFSLTACAEVENGSKIERITITLQLTDSEGEVTTYDITAKLYVDFAPQTIEHIKTLIKNGYYNGVDVTNVASSYFQFGDYSVGANGLTAIDNNVTSIAGEFEKAGWTGNRLTISQGSLILKRSEEATEGSKYDTGKATIAVALSASAPFSASSYCVFGKIVNDDGNKEADSSSEEYLSSLDKVLKISEYVEDANGRKLYYCVNDETEVTDAETEFNWEGQYFTYGEYDDEFSYFKGIHSASEIATSEVAEAEGVKMSEAELADLTAKISASVSNFMVIPSLSVKIVSIKLAK